MANRRFEGKIRAPDFPGGLKWFNTDRHISLADLRGKIVILDFWTYCCINCMHILPHLRKLEEKYPDELVVIGVHSAKFMAERSDTGIRNAIRRYSVRHPVVNDANLQIWSEYAVRAWPTLYFIDPTGRIVGMHEGEIRFPELDNIISQMIQEYDSLGILDRTPIRFNAERAPEGILAFPGKVLALEDEDSLYIADSNHNRILECSLSGKIRRIWGNGEEGLVDGSASEAKFNHPQGMAIRGNELYVADTENHALRLLHLNEGKVETIAGTGEQGYPISFQPSIGKYTELNSPWDLEIVNDVLYIAMAGCHQIWAMEMPSGVVRPLAGTAREGIKDGPASAAWLAQPSGLTTDGQLLYFADSETSSIRLLDPASGRVETLVGIDLFEFGDVDGVGGMVRLQHPLDVEWHAGKLYIADSYNNKIKILDPHTRECRTWVGSGKQELRDGTRQDASLAEPGGLSATSRYLYVADTNNHAIRIVDFSTGEVSTLKIHE
ncbi:alkyl hydroperoxide reductase/ Thiol specific antioxidant/ Mal allergen [Thermobaculum terrenum ATCC BAA-798]|uniref:Alkyl hydroperoxide reductase/ Thiol specific antioxidant/ Mal allergen n=1 Tax=Thermobaculum terrenum (strain ATCC BAA-798 / CCMEE 7001 / YNP1) TaxID=525904 RepID=D1CBM9_THET1|nr:thioredoxin-like domain-containing protein [Thermobaculum terrenum]ACZ42194.1 alkyl hydroperoxide reductase/ Thiol specific antioxidant/ Mal allergen [Thermobaculum terrenum ATCC BAA-798]